MTQPCHVNWMHVLADLRTTARSRRCCNQLCFFFDTYFLPICATSLGRTRSTATRAITSTNAGCWRQGTGWLDILSVPAYGQPCNSPCGRPRSPAIIEWQWQTCMSGSITLHLRSKALGI